MILRTRSMISYAIKGFLVFDMDDQEAKMLGDLSNTSFDYASNIERMCYSISWTGQSPLSAPSGQHC